MNSAELTGEENSDEINQKGKSTSLIQIMLEEY